MRYGFGFAAALCLFAMPAAAQKKVPVDLELAFVVDASGSIDDAETRLQRQGYADALAHPKVLDAIGGGFLRAIAVTYIEFAADGCTRTAVNWARIDGPQSAKAFGDRVIALDRMYCPGGNAIGEAIAHAHATMEVNGFAGTRRVIDVSGDGPNTTGVPLALARTTAIADGITINGLVIERPSMPELEDYYRAAVIGGPRAFVIKAKDRRTFADAILKKMILEIAGRGAATRLARRETPSGNTARLSRR